MGFLNRLERVFGRLAIPNISLYLVMGQVLFWAVSFLGLFDLRRIVLVPAAVLEGEAWRLFSFLLLPPNASPVFIAFAWYLFYMMGSALEQYWGVFRYNLFLFVGWLLTVGVAFLSPYSMATNLFLAGSVFLAFAFLNPEFEMMLFFILPVKIKWLALIQWILYGFAFVRGDWPVRLAVLAAVGNFFAFFTGEIIQRMKTGKRRMEHQARQAAARDNEEPRHTCVVCGKNDRTHPKEEFRYSDDDRCYCAEHRPKKA
jgi:membrane associated rhomboid family serine protease